VKTLFASRMTVNSTAASPWALVVLPVCLLLSGFAGMVYQIAWTRQFALVFGTTEIAVTLVLAAYMAGLGLGAWLVQRVLPFLDRPVLAYATLELIIGASAVALVPALIGTSDWLLRSLYGHHAGPPGADQLAWISLFYAGGAFAALAIPTLCMGATLPLLTRQIVENDRQTGHRVGLLFTFNTAGAVAGALAGIYWMLPNMGLTRTVWSAAAVNVLAAVLALTVSRRSTRRRAGFSTAWAAASRAPFSLPPAPVWILPLMFLSGAVALFHEVLWTRLLSHVLGSSLHAFGIMLASFLGGLALGAAAGSTLAGDRRAAVPGFAVCQMACALAAASAYILVNRLLPDTSAMVSNTLLAAVILVPIAFFSGATFPLAVRILARRTEDAAPAAARVYAWNTFGAIIGALTAGFALIPALRFEGSIQLAVAASAALAVAAALLLERTSRGLSITVGVIALAIVAAFWPPVPMALLRASPLQISNAGRMLYYGIGRSASVVVLEQNGALAFRTNGLPEALVEMRGAAPKVSGEKWLVPLAILAQPRTSSMLVVGYGGGVVLDDVPESVRQIDVIEIEPRVIDANIATRSLRKRDPLTDQRIKIIINDARGALNLTNRQYDAIVSQPSHPWTAAASHLYTREFLLQARAHLTDNGVFVQWMNLSFIDESLLRSFAATVLDVFAEARLYRPDPFTLVFVAGKGPDRNRPLSEEAFPRFGINTPEDIFVAMAADAQALRQLSHGAPLITDDRNRMATAGAYQTGLSMTLDAADRFLAPSDPLRRVNGSASKLQPGYLAERLATLSATHPGARARLDTLASVLDPASQSGYEVNAERLTVDGDRDAAGDLIQQGLARYPDSDRLRFEYIRPWLARLARGTATKEVTAQASKLTGSADAVVRGSVLASQRRWTELHALDESLAQARWSDPWKLDAILLQVQWRCEEESASDVRRQRGDEALAMIDEAVAARPALILYALRVQSALAAHRSEAIVESIWEYGHGLFADAPEPPERAQTRTALNELLQLLDRQTGADRAGADTARVEQVRDRLLDDVRELSLGDHQ
jgi:spermidine synthase